MQDFDAIESPHHPIQQDQIRFLGSEHFESFVAVGGSHGLIPLLLEFLFEEIDIEGLVIDDQDARRDSGFSHR